MPKLSGPLNPACIDSVTRQDHDHRQLWSETNNLLRSLSDEVATLKSAPAAAAATTTTTASSTSAAASSSGSGGGSGPSSPLAVSGGGTGTQLLPANAVLLGEGPSQVGAVTPSAPRKVLTDNGAGSDPSFQSMDAKASCRLATAVALPAYTYSAGIITANANGALTVDGVSPAVGDRVLVKNGAAGSDNGIYDVTQVGDVSHPFILTRSIDCFDSSTYLSGSFTFVQQGTANAASIWLVSTLGVITVGTTSVTWQECSLPVPVPVAKGGTGDTVLTAHAVLLGEGASPVAFAAPGTAGQVLTSNGAGVDPGFQALPAPVYASTPFTSLMGNLTVAHGLGYSPSFAVIAVTSDGITPLAVVGWQQMLRWDATNFYLDGAAAGIIGYIDSIK